MIIDVQHECENGWHVFTSPHVPGLFLTGQQDDLEELYDEIPHVICALARADFGQDVVVEPVQTYLQYVEGLPDGFKPGVKHFSIQKIAA